VVALASSGNVEERVQASVDVGETFTTYVGKIEVELQKPIDMINGQEIMVLSAMLEQNDVQCHVEIDGGDTLHFTSSNYLPHQSSQVKKMGGVSFVNFFVTIPSLITWSSSLCLTFILHVRGWVGHFLLV